MTRLTTVFSGLLALNFLAVFTVGQEQGGGYKDNAAFLSRRFLTDARNAPGLTDDFLDRTTKSYKTPFLFPNGGLLNSQGVLDHASSAGNIFLDHVAAFEREHHVSFTLIPYLNGYSLQDTAHAADARLDLGNPSVRKRIIAECKRYVSADVAGSYVKGTHRAFDGIMLDIEPAGDPAFLETLKTLLKEIRDSFDRMGLNNKKIAFAAPQLTRKNPKPNWGWDLSDYHYMAKYVDYIMAMTYDSGLKTPEYQAWMGDQTTQILRAVSGAAWNFDDGHPQPGNGVKVFIGLPGLHTQTRAHDPAIEDVAHGAPGILQALSALNSTDRRSLSYFQGAAMFSHDGGAVDSIYARYDTDWREWLEQWVSRHRR